jgi:hypothetical protein
MEAICMSDDERFVREVWCGAEATYGKYAGNNCRITVPNPHFKGAVWIISGNGNAPFEKSHHLTEAAAWSAARQFTEARINEVEDVREEIDAVLEFMARCLTRRSEKWERILTRIRAEQSRLTQGMRPKYVAERGWAQ